jgi:hypothetical protein
MSQLDGEPLNAGCVCRARGGDRSGAVSRARVPPVRTLRRRPAVSEISRSAGCRMPGFRACRSGWRSFDYAAGTTCMLIADLKVRGDGH